MHVVAPATLEKMVTQLLGDFEKRPPVYLVDTHKVHFPWKQPPLELWPNTPHGFLPRNENVIEQYNVTYSKMLEEKIGPDEAQRYQAMQPFRDYVMKNYKIIGSFGNHVIFRLKNNP